MIFDTLTIISLLTSIAVSYFIFKLYANTSKADNEASNEN